ncbi:MAG TPA: acyl transferase [Flavobacteriales bacterium]|nr:acyl transferase [Flavobacteriales bacterium]HRE95431.1 acyl transferase [Flavobacteriales bacterium]HRJ34645.1 acyl transferase [Flavobacteriales bacterium]HRJ39508.1 acyl transferase [Flavobacteriales bacterium]
MTSKSDVLKFKLDQVNDPDSFNGVALEIFHYQRENNETYKDFLKHTNRFRIEPAHWTDIPCIPVSFFKTLDVRTGSWKPETIFTSSGTSGHTTSKHPVKDTEFYLQNTRIAFENKYGVLSDLTLLALLPGYLERQGSSLVAMADYFIRESKEQSGFYLNQHQELAAVLNNLKIKNEKVILLGVTHALIDFANAFPINFPELIIMETGGMKGRKKEMLRSEIHLQLKRAFGVPAIHSEYGMTELFSQAYSKGDGIFHSSDTLRIRTRELSDPFQLLPHGSSGAINIYDLANIDTLSFISIDDLGRTFDEYSFEVLGRIDNCDIRGCNLMVV